jgi:hypothetical protein
MKVVLVCIAKDEDFYLDEWLEYNKKLGFDEIVMYENDWRCNIEKPFLRKIQMDGLNKQLEAYNDFIFNRKEDYNYAAFIDCDEFIVLRKHNNIKEFLEEYGNPKGIAINWHRYGSLGKLTRKSNSLLKTFTLRESKVDSHIKTILNLDSKGYMILPHNPDISIPDTNGKEISGPFNHDGPEDVISINHYHHKTYEDWEIRCNRGRADTADKNFWWKTEQWNKAINLFRETEDLTAHDFFYKKD